MIRDINSLLAWARAMVHEVKSRQGRGEGLDLRPLVPVVTHLPCGDGDIELLWLYLREHLGQEACMELDRMAQFRLLWPVVLDRHERWLKVSRYLSSGDKRQGRAAKARLGGVDLRMVNLRKVNLSEAWMPEVNLGGADLQDANLRGAFLHQALLVGADLSGANLEGANLRKVNLRGAKLVRANLKGAFLTDTDLTGADLTGASLAGAYMGGCAGILVEDVRALGAVV